MGNLNMFHPEQLQMKISLVAIFPEQLLRKTVFLVLKNLIFQDRKYALPFMTPELVALGVIVFLWGSALRSCFR